MTLNGGSVSWWGWRSGHGLSLRDCVDIDIEKTNRSDEESSLCWAFLVEFWPCHTYVWVKPTPFVNFLIELLETCEEWHSSVCGFREQCRPFIDICVFINANPQYLGTVIFQVKTISALLWLPSCALALTWQWQHHPSWSPWLRSFSLCSQNNRPGSPGEEWARGCQHPACLSSPWHLTSVWTTSSLSAPATCFWYKHHLLPPENLLWLFPMPGILFF